MNAVSATNALRLSLPSAVSGLRLKARRVVSGMSIVCSPLSCLTNFSFVGQYEDSVGVSPRFVVFFRQEALLVLTSFLQLQSAERIESCFRLVPHRLA